MNLIRASAFAALLLTTLVLLASCTTLPEKAERLLSDSSPFAEIFLYEYFRQHSQ